MQINVKTLTGETFALDVSPSDTIDTIKSKIRAKENIVEYQQRLLFSGDELKDGTKTLAACNITADTTIHLVVKSTEDDMTITIELPDGQKVTFEIKPSEKIKNVKTRIRDREGTPVDVLRFGVITLDDEKTLDYYRIKQNAVLRVEVEEKLCFSQIFVKDINGKTVTLDAKMSDSVESIRAKLEQRLAIPAGEQRLIFQGKQLENGHPLSYYNVKKKSTLHLVMRMLGGDILSTFQTRFNLLCMWK